jgi:hypothetical protein
MILRKIIPILIVSSSLSPSATAQKVSTRPPVISYSSTVDDTQDFSEIVVPITAVRLTPSVKFGMTGKLGPKLNVDANFGTGFCLDAACRFIVTNYHVAMTARVHKIKGEKIVQRYLATGPNDNGATAHGLSNGDVLPYVTSRDLAILELRRSLPHHHGLIFSLDEPEVGQKVYIYGYPGGIISPIRKLTRFPAIFKAPTTSGLLAFDYELSGDKPIRVKGASGGIVVDRKTKKILGILSETNETTALAVPVQTLIDFVSKVQPFLAQRIFPATKNVSPVSADLYPKFMPAPDHNPKFVPVHSVGLQQRSEELPEVKALRSKAQALADSMRNYIAVQSFEWGSGDKEPAARAMYEVRVIDGVQRFREYPDGKKESELASHPRLNDFVVPAKEWSSLPTMVGTEFRLRVQQAPDVLANERRMKVFQYYSTVEDNLCPIQVTLDFLVFKISKLLEVGCYGEVWTDENTNIIRISQNLELSDKSKDNLGWEETSLVITYGWINITDEPPQLAPLTIFIESRYKNKRVYWCRGQFTDYRRFASRVKIIASQQIQ